MRPAHLLDALPHDLHDGGIPGPSCHGSLPTAAPGSFTERPTCGPLLALKEVLGRRNATEALADEALA